MLESEKKIAELEENLEQKDLQISHLSEELSKQNTSEKGKDSKKDELIRFQ